MLITIGARLVRPYGTDEVALPQGGRIEYRPEMHGVWEGALRGRETVTAKIADGIAEQVELTPGVWRVRVVPDHGTAWESWLIELEPGMPEPVDLVDLAPVIVIDGEKWAQGEPGPPGASVTGAVDNGDQTVSFTLSDGTETDPVPIPPGPAGVGVASISDPDAESRVTVTYTDGSTSTVQAIRGAPGDDGHTPAITWAGTALVIDGETGPDLAGAPGAASTIPGPANTLSIGTVTTGATGDPASAAIRGDAPEQTLDLVLPRGDQGIPGTATLPSTGKRRINSSALSTGYVQLERIGPLVTISLTGTNFGVAQLASVTASTRILSSDGIPAGFRPQAHTPGILTLSDWRQGGIIVAFPATDAAVLDLKNIDTTVVTTATNLRASVMFVTADPWPTTLPGTPIS